MANLPPTIEILTEDEAYEVAAQLQKLITVSTYCDTQATALQKRIAKQLKREGLDHAGRFSFLLGTDADRTAKKVVEPLRVIHGDTYNAAQSAVVFRNRMQSLVFDPIRAARREMTRADSDGLTVR
jgi:hypothetical protein